MITEIKVYSRLEMQLIANGIKEIPYKEWNLISIYSPTQPPLFLDPEISLYKSLPIDEKLKNMQDKGCKYTLSLAFDDILPKQIEKSDKYVIFNEKHAQKTLDFLDDIHNDKDSAALVIHCHAGISRSGAIAYFASQKYNINFEDPYIYPNSWVLELLCQTNRFVINPFKYDGTLGDKICQKVY